jgi:hypothetical protein
MSHAKPCSSPAASGKKLAMFDGDPLPDPTEYRSVVGALQYLTLTVQISHLLLIKLVSTCIVPLLLIGLL